MSSSEPSLAGSPLPEAGNDPQEHDQLRNDSDPEPAPIGAPDLDMDELSDDDSVLSEVDEAQFENFDVEDIAIDERPAIAVDEDTVKLLGRHKRKREEGADGEVRRKKKKEKRREKPKRTKPAVDGEFDADAEEGVPKSRKSKVDGEPRREKPKPRAEPEDESNLTPEERRRKALDRAMDAALKGPKKQRKRGDGIDISTLIDDEIAVLRNKMADAAEKDNVARMAVPPQQAIEKLKLLPEVVALLNRNGREVENAIVDPDNNLLEAVRWFLEPLGDGSLPAFNIQRELFNSLTRLSIQKDALMSSKIGMVILFYTKSRKVEPRIKIQAERLLAEWTRPILSRSDDYRKRVLATADYDPTRQRPRASQSQTQTDASRAEAAALKIKNALAPKVKQNRARLDTTLKTYTVAPRSNLVDGGQFARPIGASGEDAFRKLKARTQASQGKSKR